MRTLIWSLAALMAALALASSALAVPNGDAWGVLAPQDWTPETDTDTPSVNVDVWLTEGGSPIAEGIFIGPMLPGELRPVDARVFRESDRTICLNASAEHAGFPETRVQAVPSCESFPRVRRPLVPPTLLAPSPAP